jgi:hypothetical protein
MASIPDLNHHIQEHTEAIPNDLLQLLMTSLPSPMQECRDDDVGRLKNAIFIC